jgi:hypothetical protein
LPRGRWRHEEQKIAWHPLEDGAPPRANLRRRACLPDPALNDDLRQIAGPACLPRWSAQPNCRMRTSSLLVFLGALQWRRGMALMQGAARLVVVSVDNPCGISPRNRWRAFVVSLVSFWTDTSLNAQTYKNGGSDDKSWTCHTAAVDANSLRRRRRRIQQSGRMVHLAGRTRLLIPTVARILLLSSRTLNFGFPGSMHASTRTRTSALCDSLELLQDYSVSTPRLEYLGIISGQPLVSLAKMFKSLLHRRN